MEFLLELLLELVIQVVGEALVEFGLHSMAEPFRRPPNPWVAAIGYALIGAIVGGISLWPFPDSMMIGTAARWTNLILTPIAAGLCMVALGAWRARRGQTLLRIDRFSYGYLFALSLAIVRFVWAG